MELQGVLCRQFNNRYVKQIVIIINVWRSFTQKIFYLNSISILFYLLLIYNTIVTETLPIACIKIVVEIIFHIVNILFIANV